MQEYFESWTETELRDGIWMLNNGMAIRGPYQKGAKETLRQELRRRGLSDRGHHEHEEE